MWLVVVAFSMLSLLALLPLALFPFSFLEEFEGSMIFLQKTLYDAH